jgi:predicted dehydrogenase
MKKYRVAILGTSFGRMVQVPGFQRHPGFEVVALAGSDAAKTERIAAESGIAKGYGDWRELLEREKPDLVSIVTPVYLHHPMMLAAIEAGAHVHCEKPTAMHRFQAAEMAARANAAGRVAGINHEFRFFPARQYALALAQEGAIGAIRRAEILGRYPLWTTPASRGMTWLSDAARGGGILGALGSHHTDCFRTFLGEPQSVIAHVRVSQPKRGVESAGSAGGTATPTATATPTGTATADDAFTLEYTFANGATALIDLDATAPYRWERFEVHGEKATLRWDETGYRLWRIDPGAEPVELEIPARYHIERVDGDPALVAPFRVLVQKLYDAIDTGAPLSPSFAADAVPVQSALDAARASSEAGTRVAVLLPEVAAAS